MTVNSWFHFNQCDFPQDGFAISREEDLSNKYYISICREHCLRIFDSAVVTISRQESILRSYLCRLLHFLTTSKCNFGILFCVKCLRFSDFVLWNACFHQQLKHFIKEETYPWLTQWCRLFSFWFYTTFEVLVSERDYFHKRSSWRVPSSAFVALSLFLHSPFLTTVFTFIFLHKTEMYAQWRYKESWHILCEVGSTLCFDK